MLADHRQGREDKGAAITTAASRRLQQLLQLLVMLQWHSLLLPLLISRSSERAGKAELSALTAIAAVDGCWRQ